MPLPPVQTTAQLQALFVNAWASALNAEYGVVAANIPRGDPILALGFGTAGVAVYLQAQLQAALLYSRASTATGTSLDSWLADFGPGAERPPGGLAEGWISVPTPTAVNATSAVAIPEGSVFQTAPIVVSPSTVPTVFYFTTTEAAVIPVGSAFVLVPYQATQSGAQANGIPATTSLQFSSSIVGTGNPSFSLAPGQSTGNAAPTGGSNPASDPVARANFVDFVDGLAGSIESAIIAGIQEVSSYLVNGSTFVLWDYATEPTSSSLTQLAFPGQAVCVFVSPNPANTGQYLGPLGTDPIADAILQAMNGSLSDPTEGVAFTVVPLVYYAKTYEITTLSIGQLWVSQSALSAAGLTWATLQSALQGLLQTLIGLPSQPGLPIAAGIPWSTLIQTLKDFSVTQANGAVVTGIVTDVFPSTLTAVVQPEPSGSPVAYSSASDGGPVPNATHQATVEGNGDPGSVLRWGASLNVTWPGTPNYVA